MKKRELAGRLVSKVVNRVVSKVVRKIVSKVALFILLSLSLPLISAQTLYQQDSLLLQLAVESQFELKPTTASAELEKASADLLLFPSGDFRQKIVNLDSKGFQQNAHLRFEWADQKIEKKKYGYTALVETNNQQLAVEKKITYPLTDQEIAGLEEYLQPTKTIDSNNLQIVAKAAELAEGEDDLFKVVFKLASWVEENVNYDLNTLTQTAALPASWVLENREGVCDEMTSLFIAMARSLGIPARFVSGISYSSSPLFPDPWQPHGWAEVYFSGIGWVGFDITFGEYGYVDVTHIKLRDGFDPAEPATRFEWLAKDVELKSDSLNLAVKVLKTGEFVPEKIQLEQEILAPEVGSGSYNLIKGILKNTENYYAAATLALAVPEEINILGRNKRTILLSPKEIRETYWVVKTPEGLPQNYIYTYPAVIYSEKNISREDSFKVIVGKISYTKEDVEKLTVSNEEKTYSRKVTFDCQYPRELPLGGEEKVACAVRNRGNLNLKELEFCLSDVCEKFNLPINQEKTSQITVKGDKAGLKKIVITAENADIEKKSVIEYAVLDPPGISIKIDAPAELNFRETAQLTLKLEKTSFSLPQKIHLTFSGAGVEYNWDVNSLPQSVELLLQLQNLPLKAENKFLITASWEDAGGKSYFLKKELNLPGKARTFLERLKMLLNKILPVFS